jgi:hypothetical protein
MNGKQLSICVTLSLLLATSAMSAATISARALKDECTAELSTSGDAQHQALSAAETSWKLGHCTGYIAGFMDANQNVREGVSVKEIQSAFLEYVRKHPTDEESSAWWVLEASARDAGLTYKK